VMATKAIKVFLPFLGGIFAYVVLRDALTDVDYSAFSITFPFFLLAFFILLIVFYMDAVGWFLINKSIGVSAARDETIFVWLSSSVTRYIPGVIWGYASRALFLKEKLVPVSSISLSFICEAGFLFSGSVLIGINILWFSEYRNYFSGLINYNFLLLVMIVGCLVAGGVWFGRSVIERALTSFAKIHCLRFIYVFGFYLLLWGIFFCSFVILTYSIFSPLYDFSVCIKVGLCFCLAFGLSFVLIIFPSGIGVREVIFFTMLSPIVDPSSAALLSVLSRVWVVGGELVCLLLCLVWYFVIGKSKYYSPR
jgi:uncharacterized membrane protein YbhN (UPF0104 family)